MTPDPLIFDNYLKKAELPERLALSRQIADTIIAHFNRHFRIFSEISSRGRGYFIEGNWKAIRGAVREQISLYDKRVQEAIADVKQQFAQSYLDTNLWQDVKYQYLGLLYTHRQPELAETFYNSVFTGLFERHYYNNEHIFVRPVVSTERIEGSEAAYRSYYPTQDGWRRTILRILADCDLSLPPANMRRDARNILQTIEELPKRQRGYHTHFQIQMLTPVFYRNKGAYLVGRIINGAERLPFVIAFARTEEGQCYVETLITDMHDVTNVFSFSRNHFLVNFEIPSALIRFLTVILPSKTTADIYNAIGFHKQGKAEFYRDFLTHLRHSNDKLRVAPGIRGLVMVVFTLPSYPYVFKVVKDRFPPPKETTQQKVVQQYRWVKSLDRVGRMADTWEFSFVAFPEERFEPALIEELEREIPSKVIRENGMIIIRHLFIEHRLTPLNISLDKPDHYDIEDALKEYGQAIKDISGSGIFPSDLLTKNFGLTRHGRVIFYDYDEIVPIDECNFRKVPEPRTPEDEFADTPWYSIAPNDIFPEEWLHFVVNKPQYRRMLLKHHADLFDASYWQKLQQAVADGYYPDVVPYRHSPQFDLNS